MVAKKCTCKLTFFPAKHKVFKTFLRTKIFLLLNDLKGSDSMCKKVRIMRYHVAYNLVEMEFSSSRKLS